MQGEVVRHPIRGILWGLLFGIGLYLLLVGLKIIAIGETPKALMVIAAGVVLNVLWSLFAPPKRAKAPKGAASLPLEPLPAAAAAPGTAAAPASAAVPEPPMVVAEPTAPPPPPPPSEPGAPTN